jgi:hypothetical protein
MMKNGNESVETGHHKRPVLKGRGGGRGRGR